MFFNKYPYSDFHELNLDWVIAKMKELNIAFEEFKVVNNITFSGQWDITKQYPAWTIVSDNNIGYVSLQPVPVGVPLTNGNYWVEVIDYTAQIAGLESRVIALEGDVLDLQNDVAANTKLLDTLTNKNVIIIGDSYGVDAQAGGTSWATYLESWATDATITRATVGGLGYMSDLTVVGDNYLSILQGLTIDDPDKITDIIIIGGANDANILEAGQGTATDLRNRIDAFMSYCKSYFKNATVKVSFVGWYDQAARLPYYIQACKEYRWNKYENMKYYPDGENILHNYNFINHVDHVHPTAAGSAYLGYFAMSVLQDADFKYTYDELVLFYPYTTLFTSIDGVGDVRRAIYNNDICRFRCQGTNNQNFLNCTFASPTNIGIGADFPIANVTNLPVGYDKFTPVCETYAIFGISGGSTSEAKIQVYYKNQQIWIRVTYINPAITAVNMLLPPFALEFDLNHT